MAIIPCTKCPACGLWNQFSLTHCECGADLRKITPVLTDVSRLSPIEYGEISENIAAYGQICPKCSRIAYTTSPKQRHSHCPGCCSDAIAAFRPIHYLDIPEPEAPAEPKPVSTSAGTGKKPPETAKNKKTKKAPVPAACVSFPEEELFPELPEVLQTPYIPYDDVLPVLDVSDDALGQ